MEGGGGKRQLSLIGQLTTIVGPFASGRERSGLGGCEGGPPKANYRHVRDTASWPRSQGAFDWPAPGMLTLAVSPVYQRPSGQLTDMSGRLLTDTCGSPLSSKERRLRW